MKEKKILITDGVHPILPDELKKTGFSVDYHPDISPEKAGEMIGPYHGMIINSKIKVDAPFLDRAPLLEFVGRLGSGMEIIDQQETQKRNIAVFNSPEDRKSTRLNSSHVAISYAVFCLKKKK